MTTTQQHETKLIERAWETAVAAHAKELMPPPHDVFAIGWRAGYDEGLKWQDNKKQIAAAQLRDMLQLYQEQKRGMPTFDELVLVLRLVEGPPAERSIVCGSQDEYRKLIREVGDDLSKELLEAASQPSAASDPPPFPNAWDSALHILWAKEGVEAMLAESNAAQKYAALTGAAPADANVGGLLSDSLEWVELLSNFAANPSLDTGGKLTDFADQRILQHTTPTAPSEQQPLTHQQHARARLISRLQACVDDPMWPDHAEVSKKLLEACLSALVNPLDGDL